MAQKIAALAGIQGGHVTSTQLRELGLQRNAIRHRLRRGSLIRVFYGVYAVGHVPTQPVDRAHGALLACGDRATLAGSSAAAFWGLRSSWSEPFEVISANDRRPSGITVHVCRTLIRRDIRQSGALRVTSPARTLLDVAPEMSRRHLVRAIEDLRLQRRVTSQQLIDVINRNPYHAGSSALRPLALALQPEPTRSELEDAFMELVDRHGLPEPLVNVRIAGYRVDAFFEAAQLIVELDGWATHGTRRAFARDRAQDAAILAATGIPTIRFTYGQTTTGSGETAALLRELLNERTFRAKGAS